LWQNVRSNGIQFRNFDLPTGVNYLNAASVRALASNFEDNPDLSEFTIMQPDLRTPYLHSYFLGFERHIGTATAVELNSFGAFGHKFITTDVVNRPNSVPASGDNPDGNVRPKLGLINYRGNQGTSHYSAIAAVVRHRGRRVHLQASYTWSRTVDNQSEPLAGELYNLGVTQLAAELAARRTAFTRQYDSSVDIGNSDFDQRHNLVFYSVWEIPALFTTSRTAPVFRNWRVSQVAAIRSGLPFTVFAPALDLPATGGVLYNNRGTVVNPALIEPVPESRPAGERILTPAAFQRPATGIGNSLRNQFHGPGFYSLDFSLSRSFALSRISEKARVTVRVDAFNILNHPNLNNPDSALMSPTFGVARFGRQGLSTQFPSLTPFNETARQIQLLFRAEF
jgi:hypothetical protein